MLAPLVCLDFTAKMWQNHKAQIVMNELFGKLLSAADRITPSSALSHLARKPLTNNALLNSSRARAGTRPALVLRLHLGIAAPATGTEASD
jgi:hypothetical protein